MRQNGVLTRFGVNFNYFCLKNATINTLYGTLCIYQLKKWVCL